VPDETGWRVGGHNAWLHVFVGERATCYEIDTGRGRDVAERLLGSDWSGLLVHDGWSPYDGFTQARHQQCLAHLRRRCGELLETARGGAVRLPRRVLELTDIALHLRNEYQAGRRTAADLAEHGLGLAWALDELVQGRFTYEPNRQLAQHLEKHLWNWFWFLLEPGTDATNHQAEQAIRPAVVNRKVWGGNRTWIGAVAQSVLTSVVRTCTQTSDFVISLLQKPSEYFGLAGEQPPMFGRQCVPGLEIFRPLGQLRFRRDHAELLPALDGFRQDRIPALVELALVFVSPLLRNMVRARGLRRARSRRRTACPASSTAGPSSENGITPGPAASWIADSLTGSTGPVSGASHRPAFSGSNAQSAR
jgi:hypothetical protein